MRVLWKRSARHTLILGLLVFGGWAPVFSQTWNVNADGSWTTNSNWNPSNDPNGVGANATLGSIITANRTVTLNNNITLGKLNINDDNSYTISRTGGGTRTLTFNESGSGPAQINILNSGSPTISGSGLRVALTDPTVINHTGTGVFTISSIIQGGGSLTHNGTGTTVLSGANTYDGATLLNGGVLSVSSLADGGSSSNIGDSSSDASNLVFNGGTLRYTGTGSTSDRLFTLGTDGGTIEAVGSGALNFDNTDALEFSGSGARILTLDGTSTATNNLAADINNGTGGATSVVKDGTGTWRISGDNGFTGSLTVKDGLLQMNSNTINGAVPEGAALVVGDGIGSALSAIARNLQEGQVGNTSTLTVNSDGWFDINASAYPNKGGDSYWKEETVGQVNLTGGRITTGAAGSLNINGDLPGVTIASFSSSQTALIDATGGQLALNANRIISVQDGAQATDLEIRGTIANSVTGSGTSSVTKTGDGRLTYTGTTANTYTGATVVNGGTLELAKSSGVTSIASSSVSINSGGTLLMGSNNQINNAAALTLNGGILSTGETVGYNETLGTLTMSASSTIDLGTAAHLLQFANSSALAWSGTMTITGWTGLAGSSGTQGQIFFDNNVSGLNSTQLASINFDGFGPGAMLLTSGELVPIPIPDAPSVVAACLLLGVFGWRERNRLARHLVPWFIRSGKSAAA